MEKIKSLIVKEQGTTNLGQTYNLGADAENIDYNNEDGTTQDLQVMLTNMLQQIENSKIYWK